MRLRDTPTVEVSERLTCTPERAWELVTDIALPTRVDGELQRVEWLDGASGVQVGARFRGHNANPQLGQWQTESEVVEVEVGRRWVWQVGPADGPFAMWGFEVEPAREGVVVRQWGKVGPGPSPLSAFVAEHPDREGAIVEHRLGVWRAGLSANLAELKRVVG